MENKTLDLIKNIEVITSKTVTSTQAKEIEFLLASSYGRINTASFLRILDVQDMEKGLEVKQSLIEYGYECSEIRLLEVEVNHTLSYIVDSDSDIYSDSLRIRSISELVKNSKEDLVEFRVVGTESENGEYLENEYR